MHFNRSRSLNVHFASLETVMLEERTYIQKAVVWLRHPDILSVAGSVGHGVRHRILMQDNEAIMAAIVKHKEALEDHIFRQRESIHRTFADALRLTAAIPVVLVVLVVLVGLTIRSKVVVPILKLSDAALRIAKGDLSVDLSKRLVLDRQNLQELLTLRESMASMVDSLRERQHMEWLVRCSEKMSSIGRLAIGVAHEVNNPLANAMINLQLLEMQIEKQESVPTGMMDRVRLIRRNVDKGIKITKELLSFSKSDKDDFGPVNIREPIENALMLQEHALKTIQIKKQWLQEVVIHCLSSKLEQVFLNLLRNAADAMPDGGEIEITVDRLDSRGVIRIVDTGQGIPEMILAKVFEPFVSTKKKGDGFGLGLAVCQSIVDQHDGTIEMSSRVGHGTIVTLTFPALESDYAA